MIRTLLLAAAVALAGPSLASAKVFELPDAKPVITITLPDAWSPEEIDKGAQATSPDGSIYIAFEMTAAKDVEKAAVEAVKYLQENGVVIDPATQKQATVKFNGMDLVDLSWSGKDKDGPTNVGVVLIAATETQIAILTHWGSPAGEAKYATQLTAIQQSVQKLNP